MQGHRLSIRQLMIICDMFGHRWHNYFRLSNGSTQRTTPKMNQRTRFQNVIQWSSMNRTLRHTPWPWMARTKTCGDGPAGILKSGKQYPLTVRPLLFYRMFQNPIECLAEHLTCPHFNKKNFSSLDWEHSVCRLSPAQVSRSTQVS